MMREHNVDQNKSNENDSLDFAEGLHHMMSSGNAHTLNNMLSATMSRKLLSNGNRFQFSHES